MIRPLSMKAGDLLFVVSNVLTVLISVWLTLRPNNRKAYRCKNFFQLFGNKLNRAYVCDIKVE